MSKSMNWAECNGSSDEEGSVDEQPIARQRKPSEDRSQEPPSQQQQQQHQPHSSSAPSRQQRPRNTNLPDHPPFAAYVSNLNYHVTEDVLGDFFHGGGCNVKDVHIQMSNGKSRGAALVEFRDRESLEKSLGAHDEVLDKRAMHVSVSDKPHRGGGGGNRDRDRGGRGDNDRYARDNRGGDRGGDRRNDRGDRGRDRGGDRGGANNYNRGGDARGADWSRGETRSRGNLPKDSHKTPSTEPGVVASAPAAPPTRKKLDLTPRQAPIDTIGERVTTASSIFGFGKAREEVTPTVAASLTKEVKDLTIDRNKANTDNEATDTSTNNDNKAAADGEEDKKKKEKDHKSPKDSNKKDRNTPRDNRKNEKDHHRGDRRGGTPKSQPSGPDRRAPPHTGATGHGSGGGGGGDAKSKKSKGKPEKSKEKEKHQSEESAEARFLAANEKLQKPVAAVATAPKKVNAFSALMDDDSDSDSN
jgi:RNA recognition motif-containing protein